MFLKVANTGKSYDETSEDVMPRSVHVTVYQEKKTGQIFKQEPFKVTKIQHSILHWHMNKTEWNRLVNHSLIKNTFKCYEEKRENHMNKMNTYNQPVWRKT